MDTWRVSVNIPLVRLVLAVTISLISAGQYYFGWTNYNEAIKCLSQVPKYRIQVRDSSTPSHGFIFSASGHGDCEGRGIVEER